MVHRGVGELAPSIAVAGRGSSLPLGPCRLVAHRPGKRASGVRVRATRTGPCRDADGPAAPQPGRLGWSSVLFPEAQEPQPPVGQPLASELAVTFPDRTRWSIAVRTMSSDSEVRVAISDTVEQPE